MSWKTPSTRKRRRKKKKKKKKGGRRRRLILVIHGDIVDLVVQTRGAGSPISATAYTFRHP